MVRIRDIVIDALEPPVLARFWEAALDGYAIRAYDAEEIDRLASIGRTPETDPSIALQVLVTSQTAGLTSAVKSNRKPEVG